eukprot:TRINITY_DN399_c0_g1_i14.p2 TRINITY_DN399_c0_g1~~TRINITY_DN399_c0_g1_i14.p2  ORF type:complete len:215 (+),score=80.31 TRINITY_DN399_c0_g1_i14:34-678(+)
MIQLDESLLLFFFFFKQKTAYEISACLVGSEMCIRDRYQRRVHGVLTIITNDGKKFDVDGRIQKLSGLIQTTLQDTQETEIPIPDVDGDVFQKVVEYCQLHDYNPRHYKKPIVTKELSEILDTKDLKFLEPYNIENLKPLVDAAVYLDMKSLQDLCVIRIASEFFVGHAPTGVQEVMKRHGIKDELGLQEEEELLKKNPWLNEGGVQALNKQHH